MATETTVARGEEEGGATNTNSSELLAHTLGVALGDGDLGLAIRCADDLGDGTLLEEPVHPNEVGFVGVLGGVWWENRRAATSGVRGDGGLLADARNGLDVEVSLVALVVGELLGSQRAIVQRAASDGDGLERLGHGNSLGTVLLEEELGVGPDGNLLEVVCESNAVLVGGLVLVALGLVEGREALRGDGADVADFGDVAVGVSGTGLAQTGNLAVNLVDGLDEGGGLGSATEEGGGGLDGVDVVVQVAGQRPARGTGDQVAVLVPVVVVLGIEEALDEADGQVHRDPVLGGVVADVAHASVAQPLLDEAAGLVGGTHKGIDLVGGQMGAVALVVRVRDLGEVLGELVEVALLQADLQLHDAIAVGALQLSPLARSIVLFLDGIPRAGDDGGGESSWGSNGHQQSRGEHAHGGEGWWEGRLAPRTKRQHSTASSSGTRRPIYRRCWRMEMTSWLAGVPSSWPSRALIQRTAALVLRPRGWFGQVFCSSPQCHRSSIALLAGTWQVSDGRGRGLIANAHKQPDEVAEAARAGLGLCRMRQLQRRQALQRLAKAPVRNPSFLGTGPPAEGHRWQLVIHYYGRYRLDCVSSYNALSCPVLSCSVLVLSCRE